MTKLLEGSAQSCGCDQGAKYVCAAHSKTLVEQWQLDNVTFVRPGSHRPVLNKQEREALSKATSKKSEFTERFPDRNSKQWRKERPLYSGVLRYFPKALLEVAHVSFIGNEQHNPGEPLHWAREKSTDQLDCVARHITDHGDNAIDTDGGYHLAKAAWRSLAELELYLETH